MQKAVEKKNWKQHSSAEYEDNMYENQENFFDENTDSDIDKLNDVIGNLHLYCYESEKDQVNPVEAAVIQMKMRVVNRKIFLPTMSR